jgi:restriction endonuclease Mrr
MAIDKEERLVILYALYSCGGQGSKSRVLDIIIEGSLLKEREGDNLPRQGSETKIENDLAWARQDLKDRGFLTMPERGKWAITDEGRKLLKAKAKVFFSKPPEKDWFARFSTIFISQMKELGEKVIKEESVSGEGGSP